MEHFKFRYEFVGAYYPHRHATSQDGQGNASRWELCTIGFEARDWFGGPVAGWLKNRCSDLGIPWLEFAPNSKPTQLIQMLAEEAGMAPADVPDEEHRRSLDMWAALEQGGSIFDFD